MSSFTYIAPDASIIIEHRTDGTKVLQVHGGRATLTPDALKLLAYHAALYYRDFARAQPFMPREVVISLPPPVRLPDLL